MKTFCNTFETFGDPSPAPAESAREYARGYLGLFTFDIDMGPGRQYRIRGRRQSQEEWELTWNIRPLEGDPFKLNTGFTTEIEWWKNLINSLEDVTNTARSGLISEERLLDFLEEAVEAVEEVEEIEDSAGDNE